MCPPHWFFCSRDIFIGQGFDKVGLVLWRRDRPPISKYSKVARKVELVLFLPVEQVQRKNVWHSWEEWKLIKILAREKLLLKIWQGELDQYILSTDPIDSWCQKAFPFHWVPCSLPTCRTFSGINPSNSITPLTTKQQSHLDYLERKAPQQIYK